jgi:hypothetical protein
MLVEVKKRSNGLWYADVYWHNAHFTRGGYQRKCTAAAQVRLMVKAYEGMFLE